MKARIVKSLGGAFWVGQVKEDDWRTVTGSCYTQWGAKRELKKWKKEHCGEEFEI